MTKNDTNNVAVALIKNSKGDYLLIRLSNYPDHKNEWCPVAGHIKNGESVNEALVREVAEELGVRANPVALISEWQQDVRGEVAFWWQVEIDGDIRIDKNEVAEIGWFTSEQIKGLKLWPATKKFFEKYVWNQESN